MEAIRIAHKKRLEEYGEDEDVPTPIVWVHDYHLMLAANTIRDICDEEGLDIRMGFFLHIPFPSFDIIRIFPWVDEILQGMLGTKRKRLKKPSNLFWVTFDKFFQALKIYKKI